MMVIMMNLVMLLVYANDDDDNNDEGVRINNSYAGAKDNEDYEWNEDGHHGE